MLSVRYPSVIYSSCWLSRTGFYFAFVPPLAVIMFINIVLFILIVKGLTCDRPAGLQSTQSKSDLVQLQVFALISVFIVTGNNSLSLIR